MCSETQDQRWPVTWEASRDHQLLTALQSTPEQRLEWLEEAMQLAYEAAGSDDAGADGAGD